MGWRSSSTCTWWCSLSLASRERGAMKLLGLLGKTSIESRAGARLSANVEVRIHKQAWFVSPTARRVYRVSAGLSIALFCGVFTLLFEGIPASNASLAKVFLFAGSLGAGITFIGMEYFLFRLDQSHRLKQVFWFCIMLFPLLGAALYCFLVYSRSPVLKDGDAKAVHAAIT